MRVCACIVYDKNSISSSYKLGARAVDHDHDINIAIDRSIAIASYTVTKIYYYNIHASACAPICIAIDIDHASACMTCKLESRHPAAVAEYVHV